jgi:hypothetical protein
LQNLARKRPDAAQASLAVIARLIDISTDPAIAQLALDVLLELLSAHDASVAASTAGSIIADLNCLAGLLSFLDAPDTFLRVTTIQIMGALARLDPGHFDAGIQQLKGGSRMLVAVLDDPQDEIRNEALVLLARVTEHSSELRTLLAFEVCDSLTLTYMLATREHTHTHTHTHTHPHTPTHTYT